MELNTMNVSLPAKPLPNSNPLVAGNDITALASSASSLSKTGEPRPCQKVQKTVRGCAGLSDKKSDWNIKIQLTKNTQNK